jgi:hypothetical protein
MTNKNPSASPESALGFSFQDVYSLYLLLKDERSDLKLWVEDLDDIHIRDKDDKLTLYQLKHKKNNLTDKSDDLWKTIGNWCKLINNNTIYVENTQFKLVVIVKLIKTQIAYSLCKQYGNCNSIKARNELLKIANKDIETREKSKGQQSSMVKSHNKDTDFELFAQLPNNIREQLVSSIEIIDNTHDVTKLDSIIPSILHGVYPDNQKDVYHELIGWWQKEIRKQLSDKSKNTLTKTSVINKIAEINEKYHKDNLPLDYEKQDLEKYRNSIDIRKDNRNFVQQLKKITDNKRRIERAILDFRLVTNIRQKWVEEKLLIDNEIENYEDSLIEYWERITGGLIDSEDFAIDNAEDKKKREFGVKVYNKTEEENIPPIREKVTEKYIKMGSYHTLVEDEKVCWYPEEDIILKLFETI